MDIQPFRIAIAEEVLDDLRERLARTRWPDEVRDSGWRYGADLSTMRELADYWRTTFDWRAQEERINSFANYQATVDSLRIHFVHERGKGPNPIPLLVTHGWPSSFVEMLDLIPLLTDPAKHGGQETDAFDVTVPSIPGYGFSDRPLEPGMTRWRVAELFLKLMNGLGYGRFGLHANDVGAVISGWLALDHPEHVIGLHTLMPGFPPPAFDESGPPMTEAEKSHAAMAAAWEREEGGYDAIQATRPQTLAYGLNDSPAGLLAWIIEKWRAWTDPVGNIEDYFSRDELLTNVMIYVTQTANSAARSTTSEPMMPAGWARTTGSASRPAWGSRPSRSSTRPANGPSVATKTCAAGRSFPRAGTSSPRKSRRPWRARSVSSSASCAERPPGLRAPGREMV
jgi:pimeloyl-ACP methyl ester carboxylesterase